MIRASLGWVPFLVGALAACGSSVPNGHSAPGAGGSSGGIGGSATTVGGTAAAGSGGGTQSGGAAAGGSAAGETSGGSGGTGNAGGGSGGTAPLEPDPCIAADTCPPGEWINVTPSNMAELAPGSVDFGPGAVKVDPARPSDLYLGGGAAGLWKSTDYGNTWELLNDEVPGTFVAYGSTLAVAGTTPATIWSAAATAAAFVHVSTDGGETFELQGGGQTASLYSIQVDPYDSTHLLSGLHEADGVMESTDSGENWTLVGGAAWPGGGISWFPYFVDTGAAETTREKWFAIAQSGGSATMTSDGGAHWTVPTGLNGLQHPHGSNQIFQTGSTLFVSGVEGPGQGVYRSTDLGDNWSRVDDGSTAQAMVWGTPNNVYSMWAWACSKCDLGTNFETAALPGTSWSAAEVPEELIIGPNSVAVTHDDNHYIVIGVMWASGIWRYVEPTP